MISRPVGQEGHCFFIFSRSEYTTAEYTFKNVYLQELLFVSSCVSHLLHFNFNQVLSNKLIGFTKLLTFSIYNRAL